MCKTCHPDQPKLTLQEIQIIREKAKKNKNPKPKRCTKECPYCQKVIERKNYFINQKKWKKAEKTIQESDNNINEEQQINNIEETININETIETLKQTNTTNMGISAIEIEKDGNCLINAILKSLSIETKYNKYLRIVIANIIKSAKINEEILHSLNYNTKEEYINYVTTNGNW